MTRYKGFTLIELMIVLAIIAVLVAISSPSFSDAAERKRLVSAAENISSDLEWAKVESIKRNDPITVDLTSGVNGTWSYSFSDSDGVVRTTAAANYGDYANLSLTHNFGADDFSFDPARATVDENGTIALTSTNYDLNVVVSLLGRIRICSPSGIAGYATC
jgi:type IV fimbrial biogenesis protein FimT